MSSSSSTIGLFTGFTQEVHTTQGFLSFMYISREYDYVSRLYPLWNKHAWDKLAVHQAGIRFMRSAWLHQIYINTVTPRWPTYTQPAAVVSLTSCLSQNRQHESLSHYFKHDLIHSQHLSHIFGGLCSTLQAMWLNWTNIFTMLSVNWEQANKH